MTRPPALGWAALAALLVVTVVAVVRVSASGQPPALLLERRPQGVMGTECRLLAVVPADERSRGEAALAAGEDALRAAEARLSSWIERSEIGRLNAAPAGEVVPLSPETLEVLRTARAAYEASQGAFDVTARPLFQLWREAGLRGKAPVADAIAGARQGSNWEALQLTDSGARKALPTVTIDLGGIAKGWAIDRAIEAMLAAGARGALVDVGGDLRVAGTPAEGRRWRVRVRDPWTGGTQGRIEVESGAVCTSGGYARFVEIDGRRYSHILDPRRGQPLTETRSVTTYARTALAADVWATALSVLPIAEARDGLAAAGVQAFVLTGTAEAPRAVVTERMRGRLGEIPWPQGAQVTTVSLER